MPRSLLALVALTLALVAGACDDEPEPNIADPTTEATSEPTSAPPTSEPTSEPIQLGPVETVRAWIAGQNDALINGSFTKVDALSLASCNVCADFLQPMRDIYADGGRFETKPWRISSIKAGANGRPPNEVSVAVVIPGGKTYPSSGAEPVSYETEKRILIFRVGADAGGTSGIKSFEFLS